MGETCVYLHRRNDNNQVFYVGIGSKYRANAIKQRTDWWKRIVNKYGHTVEIIKENLKWYDAATIEIDLISKYGRMDLGTGVLCNMTDGGEGAKGRILSESHKEAIRIANTGKKHSLETREKLSIANTGNIQSQESIDKQVLSKLYSDKYKKGSSQYKGVSWCPKRNTWRANIYYKGKQTHLGYFLDEYEAFLKYTEYLKIKELELINKQ